MHSLHTAQIHQLRGLSKVKLIQQGLEILRLKECGPRWSTDLNSLLLSEILPVCVAIYLYAHIAHCPNSSAKGVIKSQVMYVISSLTFLGWHLMCIWFVLCLSFWYNFRVSVGIVHTLEIRQFTIWYHREKNTLETKPECYANDKGLFHLHSR